ncbi:MAG: DUF4255 domain-containing protein [Mariniphaga sp.]|nr:DUF4255 domain-containing protein [Mariniphaga sp.]
MISHGLTIVINELKKHLEDVYNVPSSGDVVQLGNLAEGITSAGGNGGIARGKLIFSVVNIKEEKTLKNLPNIVRNDITQRATYENPPVFLNFQILITATDSGYSNALLMLSRAIRFFQSKNVFTQDDVSPASISTNAPPNLLDRLESFKLIFDLYSPSMEEVNHLWGTLGGKQYPFVIYMMRMLDLKYRAVYNESGLITEMVTEFRHKNNT